LSGFRGWWGATSANGDRNSGRGHRNGDIVYGRGPDKLVLGLLDGTILQRTSQGIIRQGKECNDNSSSELHYLRLGQRMTGEMSDLVWWFERKG
jgi:hypothetical protein